MNTHSMSTPVDSGLSSWVLTDDRITPSYQIACQGDNSTCGIRGSIVVTTRELSPRRMGDIWLEIFIMLFTQPRIASVVPTAGWFARIGLLHVPNYVIYHITLPLGISPHIAETVLNIQLLVSSTRVSDFTCS